MSSPSASLWKSRPAKASAVKNIAQHFDLLEETASLLVRRGVDSVEAVQQFLNPTLKDLLHPDNMAGMSEAVVRILQALERDEAIMIHGDYDVDGITSSALLYRFLKSLGARVEFYIPNRLFESHGINQQGIDFAVEKQIGLVITCDCGISCAQEISELKAKGIDTIVTDHHLIPEAGPPQDAIVVNPSQEECGFGDTSMAGVGIAYYLVIALRSELREQGFFSSHRPEPNLKEFLDLVALGTIADQAPLLGQNRVLVREGLVELNNTSKKGLRTLLNLCIPADRSVSVQDVAFGIAPKINAAGRLGQADQAVKLLIEEDQVNSAVLARKLVNFNEERRAILDQVVLEANMALKKQNESQKMGGIVLAKESWHIGVLGIAAQKVVDLMHRPTLMLTRQGDLLKGSGRSVPGVHIVQMLEACRDLLVSFGGHAVACGLALQPDKLEAFRERFEQVVSEHGIPAGSMHPEVDGILDFSQVTERFINEINMLRPFGQANPEPLFVSENLQVKQVKVMGDADKHLRASLVSETGATMQGVGFGFGSFARQRDRPWTVLYTPEFNIWRGRKTIQARIQAIVPDSKKSSS